MEDFEENPENLKIDPALVRLWEVRAGNGNQKSFEVPEKKAILTSTKAEQGVLS